MPLPALLHRCLSAALPLALLFGFPDRAAASQETWRDALRAEIERIDRETPGTLGVYVKRLDRDEAFSHGAASAGTWDPR